MAESRGSLRWEEAAAPREPALLLAFEGWNDAGEAASEAVRFVEGARGARPLAAIDPDDFYDFTVARPRLEVEGGELRRLEWPRFVFRAVEPEAEGEGGTALVTGLGPEPHLGWRRFADEVLALAQSLGVRHVVLLGAYLAEILYSLPVRVSGFASETERLAALGVEPSAYSGPTGIVGVLAERFAAQGIGVTSLWAGLPHYIQVSPNPRGALALVQKTERALGLRLDETPLRERSAEFELRVSELVSSDAALADYVRELKRREFGDVS